MKKILLIDDSALMRRVVSVIIREIKEYEVAYLAKDGLEGVAAVENHDDIFAIVCDVNMPNMNGFEFLQAIHQKNIDIPVILLSSKSDTTYTIKALELGALDFIKKPENLMAGADSVFYSRMVSTLEIAEHYCEKNKKVKHVVKTLPNKTDNTNITKNSVKNNIERKNKMQHNNYHNRKIVAVVCSTGGPKALKSFLPMLPKNLSSPVVIVQHMPAGFTKTLSERLDDLCEIKVKEAEDGEYLQNGVVYIAKGGMHLTLDDSVDRTRIVFDDSPAVVGLKPCGNKMYESLINSGYKEIVCVVLTGMGADGTKGIKQLIESKDLYIIAQDEESSTVYGMPKAIYESGLTDVVCDINDVANHIVKKVGVL